MYFYHLLAHFLKRDVDHPFGSKAERELFLMLRPFFDLQPQYNFRGYRFDFALVRHKIDLEMDGAYWHDKSHDEKRDRIAEEYGWKVVRVDYDTWYKNKIPMTVVVGIRLLMAIF